MFNSRVSFSPAEVAAYFRTRVPDLSQRSRRWRGPCPLHKGKGLNFSVNPETGGWNCFSACGRGGSLIDFEMTLVGGDFKTALATICSIVGRPMPERTRMTSEEWNALQDAREREGRERKEALYFSDAGFALAEYVLESLDPHAEERAIYTRLIDDLRQDSSIVYRDCQKRDPEMVAALVEAGRRLDRRLQTWLLNFVESMAAEDSQDAA